MKLSQIIFRTSFVLLAVVYMAVIAEFLSPQYMHFNVAIRYDVIALTAIVVGYIYLFLRRTKP